jgi:hypothetical protein
MLRMCRRNRLFADPGEFDGDFTYWRSGNRSQFDVRGQGDKQPVLPNSRRQTGGVMSKVDPRRHQRQQPQQQGSETESSDWRFIALAPENNGDGRPLTGWLQRAVKNAVRPEISEPNVTAAPSGVGGRQFNGGPELVATPQVVGRRLPRVIPPQTAAVRDADDDSISSGAFNVMAYPVQGARPSAAMQPAHQRHIQSQFVEAAPRSVPPVRQYIPPYRLVPGINGGQRPVNY